MKKRHRKSHRNQSYISVSVIFTQEVLDDESKGKGQEGQ